MVLCGLRYLGCGEKTVALAGFVLGVRMRYGLFFWGGGGGGGGELSSLYRVCVCVWVCVSVCVGGGTLPSIL